MSSWQVIAFEVFSIQDEVASRFRVAPSTIINWRERGLIRYFQAPGSRRVLYPVDAIEELERKCIKQKGGNPESFEVRRK
ncbi:MAG: helix-turn-helix domain-containing protein, partial [Syntrophales bacterium]